MKRVVSFLYLFCCTLCDTSKKYIRNKLTALFFCLLALKIEEN